MQFGENDINGTKVVLGQERDGSLNVSFPEWFWPENRAHFEMWFTVGTTLSFVEAMVRAAVANGKPFGA